MLFISWITYKTSCILYLYLFHWSLALSLHSFFQHMAFILVLSTTYDWYQYNFSSYKYLFFLCLKPYNFSIFSIFRTNSKPFFSKHSNRYNVVPSNTSFCHNIKTHTKEVITIQMNLSHTQISYFISTLNSYMTYISTILIQLIFCKYPFLLMFEVIQCLNL